MRSHDDKFISLDEINNMIQEREKSIIAVNKILEEADVIQFFLERQRVLTQYRKVLLLQQKDLARLKQAKLLAETNDLHGLYEEDFYAIKL